MSGGVDPAVSVGAAYPPRWPAGTGHVDAAQLKAVFRQHPAGVAVVTYSGADGPAGFTATSVISVSVSPPIVAFSVAAGSTARVGVERADGVVVHLLAEHQSRLAERFARRGVARFDGVDWAPAPTGEPLLAEALAWLRGHVVHRLPVGDSLVVAIYVTAAVPLVGAAPLVHVDRTYRSLASRAGADDAGAG